MNATTVSTVALKLVIGKNTGKTLVPATGEPAPVEKGKRATKRAIALANALKLEQMLMDGSFRSLAEARNRLGITKSITDRLFKLLDLTPEEMEKVLNETY